MPDVAHELPTSTKADDSTKSFQNDLWNSNHMSQLKEVLDRTGGNNLPSVTRVSDTSGKAPALVLPPNLEKDLGDLKQTLEKTQGQLAELQKTCNSGLYDLELSRRSVFGNPYKLVTAGSGLAMLYQHPGYASIPLTGFAALQGYDDFKSLRDQTTLAGRTKYTLGLLSDTAVGAGALGFLTESVPMRYKAPLLIGGLLTRAAIDFIPNKK